MAAESSSGAMIDITVKTLDGQNRTFTVPENINVRQFKEKISGSIEISADTQRLIFQGRVMQDEKVLKDYDIHGKVIHLVQRAPPSTLSGSGSTTSTSSSTAPSSRPTAHLDANLFDVQIHLGRVSSSTPSSREARARIRQADFNLGLINDVISLIERSQNVPEEEGAAAGSSSTNARPNLLGEEDHTATSTRPSRTGEVGTRTVTVEDLPEDGMDTSTTPNTGRPEPEGSSTQQQRASDNAGLTSNEGNFMASELADFLDRVLSTNERMVPHIRRYRDYLRNEDSQLSSTLDAQNAQDLVSRVNEALHAMSHMLHSLSDVSVDMNTSVPRQATAIPPTPFSIPGTTSMAIPIHMNVRARQNGNGNRQRPQDQQSSPPTPAGSGATTQNFSGGTTTVHNLGATATIPGLGQFPMPQSIPLPHNLTTTGDSTVMVEVFPTGMTVVTQEVVEDDSNNDGGPANITVVSASANLDANSAASTPSSTAPPPPPSTPRTTETPQFTTTTSSSSTSTFTFSPTTSVNIGGVPTSIGIAQLPNLPGLPPGMLQNILGSILNSHGVRPGQPVQVNVQQTTTSPGASPRVQRSHRQHVDEIPLDGEHVHIEGMAQQNRADAALQTSSHDGLTDATTSTTSVPHHLSNVATNTPGNLESFSPTGNASTNATVTSSVNVSVGRDIGSLRSSSIGTRTDPNMGTNSRSTNTPRPHFHIQRSVSSIPIRATVPLTMPPHTRPVMPGISRPQGPGSLLARGGYVDPYLPCASNHYNSPTARAAYRNHNQGRGGQQQAQQVPNLSTMVSGMVGDLIEQVGQAAQQALNSGNRTSASTTSTSTSSTSSTPTTTTTTGGRENQPINMLNPMDMFSSIMSSAGLVGGQVGPIPFDLGSMLGNLINPRQAPQGSEGVPGSANTLAQLFTSLRHGNSDDSTETNVIVGLIEAVAPHMGLTDLFSLVTGNTQVLSRLRGPLRDFVRSKVIQYGSVERVVQVTLDDMNPEIQHMESLVEVRNGVDMAASVRNCLQTHLTTMFSTVNSDVPQEDFGRQLYSLWMKMMAETIGLCVYCIRDGQTGFSNMVHRYMPRMTQDMNPAITIWMTTSLQDILGTFHHNHPVPESDIMRFVVISPTSSGAHSNVQRETTSTPVCKTSPKFNSLPNRVTRGAEGSQRSLASPMEVGDSPSPQPPRAKVARTIPEDELETNEIYLDAQESLVSQPTPRARPNTMTSGSRTGVSPRTLSNGRNSDDWHTVIPQDWIPVINHDIVRQQEQRTQPPLSDAYLQGLPAKRRRMMTLEHAGEMANMPMYFPDSIARAARAVGVEPISSEENLKQEAADNHELQAELEREVTAVLAARISSDSDFNSERFPNSNEYFHKSKQH